MFETPYVATLICNPARPALDDALLARARSAAPRSGDPIWLDPGIAADIPFSYADARASQHDLSQTTRALRAACADAPIDVYVGPTRDRRKKLFLADMDSTMIGQECIDELADFAGFKQRVAGITEQAMRGEIAFEPALRARVKLLKGLPAGVIDEVIATRIRLTPGARALIATLRKHGTYTALVSGGFLPFTQRIADMVGFDETRANALGVADGVFSGEVLEPILGAQAKLEALRDLQARLAIDAALTIAVGDGANDLPMIRAAGLGCAYHAKPAVAAEAGFRIDHGDLTALLYAQGYKKDEFAL